MADDGDSTKRWIWSLHPLEKDAVDPLLMEVSDVQIGTVLKRRSWPKGSFDSGFYSDIHSFYAPTNDDLEVIKYLYPDYDPTRPPWHKIAADLVKAGHDPAIINQCSAIELVVLLQKAAFSDRVLTRSWRWLTTKTNHMVTGSVIAVLIVAAIGYAVLKWFNFSLSDFQFHTATKP